jgi:uncharacterized protein YjbJ (UPF0337 family)
MNRDELDGKANKMKGHLKEGAGELTGNERLKEEGAADRAEGEVQDTYGRGKRKVGEAVEDLGDRIKK